MQNLERFKEDLTALDREGALLLTALQHEHGGQRYVTALEEACGDNWPKFKDTLPTFDRSYQSWYTEALALIKQLLPDRANDFVSQYEKPRSRKEITFANYHIEDCLQGLRVTRSFDQGLVVGPSAAIPRMEQQLAIVRAAKRRFDSSLFDIRQMVQADLFDTELDAAGSLLKNGYLRAAGVLAGVILEKHLQQVCSSHNITISKRHPTIGDLGEALKQSSVIETPDWRFVQHLADIRNLCGHKRPDEPTQEQVKDLLNGVARIIKSVF